MRKLRHAPASLMIFAFMLAPVGGHAAAVVGVGQQLPVPVVVATDRMAAYRRPNTIPFPSNNMYTPEKARLGRALYFDPRLSRANVQSCSSCHNPALAFGDGLAKGVGDGMKSLGRRSPTIFNAAWSDALMWDGRFDTLEAQALGPIQSNAEMNMPIARVIERLGVAEGYRQMFEAAFPGQPMGAETIGSAIATYERTVASGWSPFDAWVAGDEGAISEPAKRGFTVFKGKGQCAACHNGWNFTDNGFHDVGLRDDDIGRGKFFTTVIKMQHAFKTPSLREITLRGPYMHDGSLPTLAAVVDHYNDGGVDRPSRSEMVKPLSLTDGEKSDLLNFLQTLTGPASPAAPPNLPR